MGKDLKGSILDWISNKGLSAIVIASLTLLLGLILNELQAKIGWTSLIISLSAIFAIFIFLMWFVFKNVSSVSAQLSDKIIKKLHDYVSSDRVGWMLSTEELVDYESSVRNSEVWLATSDLDEDCIGGAFQECISKNLRKGVKYRYFVPDTPAIRSRSRQILNINNNNENLSFIYLSNEFFFLVSKFDFGVINPFKEKGCDRLGFMGLPIPNDRGRYLKISDEFVDTVIGKLLPLLEQKGT